MPVATAAVPSDYSLPFHEAEFANHAAKRRDHHAFREILMFHRRHGGNFGRLVTVGNITERHLAPSMLDAFESVISVRPDYIHTQWHTNPTPARGISFVQGWPEQLPETIKPDSTDLVICLSPSDWTDSYRTIDEMARILQPGGSLAIMHQNARPQICHPAEAKEEFDDLLDFLFTTTWTEAQADEDLFDEVLRSFRLDDSRLANIHFPKTLFERQSRSRLLDDFEVVQDHRRDRDFMAQYHEKLLEVGGVVGDEGLVLRWDSTVLMARKTVS
ncbi:hypothetical protein OC846_001837 [Tilletia horrida]|uniref:Methyltransferase type 11 domain-containing protein n=1 Tax=Tilletia horrida TaxID=155126 RepID=A0AAN6GVB8_9BASI|nr:hypothetical protein OC846_001837 [Tilletia horrida]